MDNEFKIYCTVEMTEHIKSLNSAALQIAKSRNCAIIESLPINRIARPISTYLEPKRRVGSYEDFIHMNIFKGEDPEKEAAKKAAKQHKKHLATCAKNKKNRKPKRKNKKNRKPKRKNR